MFNTFIIVWLIVLTFGLLFVYFRNEFSLEAYNKPLMDHKRHEEYYDRKEFKVDESEIERNMI